MLIGRRILIDGLGEGMESQGAGVEYPGKGTVWLVFRKGTYSTLQILIVPQII